MASTNFDMDADESFHSESEFHYPDEVENRNDKENTGLLREENRQSTQFTMASMQKYILPQRMENTVKKTENDLNVWKRFFLEVGEERNIEDIPAHELNILICRFMMDMKKKDGGVYEPATLHSFQRSLQQYLNENNPKINIPIKTLKQFNAQFGGYWHFTLDSLPETKAENSDGETTKF